MKVTHIKKSLLFLLLCACTSCSQYGQLERVAQLPGRLNEVSGMVAYSSETVWVIEDGSNPDNIREVDTLGRIVRELEVGNARNKDWEALTTSPDGRMFIGDFGNNINERDNLRIYRLPDPRTEKGDKIEAEVIRFRYPDQQAFPPPDSQLRFDAEAFFYLEGYLYIITKNRSEPFDGTATVYRVPETPGDYEAERVTELNLCMDRRSCQVTDAALSSDGSRLVLLGYGYLWVLDHFGEEGFKSTPRRIALQTNTQLEGVCFVNDTLLYLSDEKSLGRGGFVYRFPLPLLKSQTQPQKKNEGPQSP